MTISETETSETNFDTFDFHVVVGQEKIELPRGFANPQHVWLIGLRNRPIYLYRVDKEEFDTGGRRYYMSDDGMPTHLRGLPLYYKIEDMKLWFWPVPAHAWQGVVQK